MSPRIPPVSEFNAFAPFNFPRYNAVVGRCVFTDSDVLDNFVDVGGEVAYLQEAASDVYVARGWIFGFGFCFSIVSAI